MTVETPDSPRALQELRPGKGPGQVSSVQQGACQSRVRMTKTPGNTGLPRGWADCLPSLFFLALRSPFPRRPLWTGDGSDGCGCP